MRSGKRRRCKLRLRLHGSTFLPQVVLAGAFYPNYFTFGQPDEEMAVRELAGKDPKTTVVVGGAGLPGSRPESSVGVLLVRTWPHSPGKRVPASAAGPL